MKKRSMFVALLLMFVMAFAVTACDFSPPSPEPSKKQFTVTFKDGDTVAKTVTVEEESALVASDIPADPTKSGFFFDGWFVGDTKVAAGYKPTADVEALAKYTEKVTATFKVDDSAVKTVDVRKGSALVAADFPANPSKANKAFEGWFVGETQINVGYVVNANVDVAAKFSDTVTIIFKVGEDTVATVTIKAGEAIDDDNIPADPSTDQVGFAFDGWYNGDVQVDETGEFAASVTLVAKFKQTHYIVTFVGGEEDKVLLVEIGGSGKIASLPSAPTSDKVFLGWYNGTTKVTTATVFAEDTVVAAAFIVEEDYIGVWYNDEENIKVIVNANGTGVFYIDASTAPANTGPHTFDEETGYLSTLANYGSEDRKDWTLLAINGVGILTYTKYESSPIEYAPLTKGEPVDYAGTYRCGSSYITITDGGIVTAYNSSSIPFFGRAYVDGDQVRFEIKSGYGTARNTYNWEFDSKGNLIHEDGRIYVKSESAVFYSGKQTPASGTSYIYVYTLADDSKLSVFYNADETEYSYVTVSGTVALNGIISWEANDVTYFAKITSSNAMAFAGAERGTYSAAASGDDLYLDGFGSATLGSADPVSYYINGRGIIVIGSAGYSLDEDKYSVASAVGIAGSFIRSDSTYYTIILDAFGGATGKYSTTYYYGKYIIEGNELTISDADSSFNGVYTIEESNKVLVRTDGKIFVFEGHTFDPAANLAEFDGWWKNGDDYVQIKASTKKIVLNKVEYTFTHNYNGTSLTFVGPNGGSFEPSTPLTATYTVTLEGGDLVMKWTQVTGVDGDGFAETALRTVTYVTSSAPTPADVLKGTKIQHGQPTYTMAFDGYGAVVCNIGASTYTGTYVITDDIVEISGAPLPFRGSYLIVEGGKILIKDHNLSTEICYVAEGYTSTNLAQNLAKFEGAWGTVEIDIDEMEITFNGSTYDLSANPDGSTLFFKAPNGGSYASTTLRTFAVSAEGQTLTIVYRQYTSWDDMDEVNVETPVTYTFTKSAPALDAFAGTWKWSSFTFIFDGQENVVFNVNNTDYEATYRINEDGEAEFVANIYEFVFSTPVEDSVVFTYDDGDNGAFSRTATKQA